MRTILFILSSLVLVALAWVSLYFSGRLFDASRKIEIEPYIFQPAAHSINRVGRPPVPLAQMERMHGNYVLERLIATFVREYLGVIPHPADLDRRSEWRSPLAVMTIGSHTPVFADWKTNVRPGLAELAEERKLRRVNVHGGLPSMQGEYYIVRFDLITYNPNDLDALPHIEYNREMRLRLRYEKGMRTERGGQPFDPRRALRSGVAPMIVFKFVVDEVR